ncbi:MAG: hypothetical protein H0W86_09480, partial [Armatimonadetes bacterium]|nr:hypothetical protein [Armatimonadota bacterium]
MISLIASMCLMPPMLLEALPNEASGPPPPLVEHRAKLSYVRNGSIFTARNAHVLCLKFNINGVQDNNTFIGIPVDAPAVEFGTLPNNTPVDWGTLGNPIMVYTTQFYGGGTSEIDVHLVNATHDPVGDLSNQSVRIYTRYYNPPGFNWVVTNRLYAFEKHLAVEDSG